jgi:hypothetical protein
MLSPELVGHSIRGVTLLLHFQMVQAGKWTTGLSRE